VGVHPALWITGMDVTLFAFNLIELLRDCAE
jgi:hypothetical protein